MISGPPNVLGHSHSVWFVFKESEMKAVYFSMQSTVSATEELQREQSLHSTAS
jgi:hypothetical protein